MPVVPVQIVQYLSDDFPGFVAAVLVDAFGNQHVFHDKAPVFACDPLNPDSRLPVTGWLGCEIGEQFTDDDGRKLCHIDTERPWHIESTTGEHRFVVAADSIVDHA
jgi:hypothetical protein